MENTTPRTFGDLNIARAETYAAIAAVSSAYAAAIGPASQHSLVDLCRHLAAVTNAAENDTLADLLGWTQKSLQQERTCEQ